MDINQWIKDKIVECNYDKNSVLKYHKQFKKDTGSKCKLDSFRKRISEVFKEVLLELKEEPEMETIKFASILSASKQKLQDKNRIIAKISREDYRIFNLLEEMNRELISVINNKSDLFNFNLKKHKMKENNQKYGILTLADLHAGCLVEKKLGLNNEYNFNILSNRMKYYVTKAIEEFKNHNVTDVLVVGLGDWISSQRRVAEKMTSATSLTRSILLTAHIVMQALIELQEYFNVSVIAVAGNESRLYDEDKMSSSDWLVSHNGDYVIFHLMRQFLLDTPIRFYDSNFREIVVNYGGVRFLFLHGDTFKSIAGIEKKVKNIAGSHIMAKQQQIDYIMFGHFHHCRISDFFSCIGTMMGADYYSDRDLHYMNRASQALFIVNDGVVEGKRIDLQNIYYNVKGYNIEKELERYNIKNGEQYNNEIVIRNLV